MSLRERIDSGKIYVEHGHPDPADAELERELERQRDRAKCLAFSFNHTSPARRARRLRLLQRLFGKIGSSPFVEGPVYCSYGCNTFIGERFYANFNFTVVDDGKIFIGDDVMCAPNVLLSTTGHPIHPEYRKVGAQFSIPIRIANGVWLGANVVVLPGVEIGENSVIGAGSVVSASIPANVVALGVPCRVLRAITEDDRNWIRRGVSANADWRGFRA